MRPGPPILSSVVFLMSLAKVATPHGISLNSKSDGIIGVCGNPPSIKGKDRMAPGELRHVSQEVLRANAERLAEQRIVVRIAYVYDELIENRWSRIEGGVMQYLRLFTHSTQLVFEQEELNLGIELVVISVKKSTMQYKWDWNSGRILDEFSHSPDLDHGADITVLMLGRTMWNRSTKKEWKRPDKWMNRVLGLAWVRSYCNKDQTGAMLVDAMDLGRYMTFAHELVHALSCNHDSETTDEFAPHCNGNDYIMSWSNGFTKVKWSSCTRACLIAYFSHPDIYDCIFDEERLRSRALKGFNFTRYDNNSNRNMFPGEIFDIENQCQYGADDNATALQSITGRNGYYFDNTCMGLLCWLGGVTFAVGHAMPGSTCIITRNNHLLTGKCFGAECSV